MAETTPDTAGTGAPMPSNPYAHRCGGLPTKAVIDCPACIYERGVTDGFKAGYEAKP